MFSARSVSLLAAGIAVAQAGSLDLLDIGGALSSGNVTAPSNGALIIHSLPSSNLSYSRPIVVYPSQKHYTWDVLAGQAAAPGFADGTGEAAGFGQLGAMISLNSDTLLVTDRTNHVIRRISLDGTVTTFAGSRLAGDRDGNRSSARFYDPAGLAKDASGNVYVADAVAHTIRIVTPAGQVGTLAGSPGNAGSADGVGAEARFNQPLALAVGSNGTVYVADSGNHVIRAITPSGEVSTFAGSHDQAGTADGTAETARFQGPSGLLWSSGALYVTDYADGAPARDCRIRKVMADGSVTTVAGSVGDAGHSDRPAGSYTPENDPARFQAPCGMAAGLNGDFFVADTGNHTVRAVDHSGSIRTVGGLAGVPGAVGGEPMDSRFSSPVAVAYSGDTVYVADAGNRRIMVGKVSSAPLILSTWCRPVTASKTAVGVVLDANGTSSRSTLEYGPTPALGQSISLTGNSFAGLFLAPGFTPGQVCYYRFAVSNGYGSVRTETRGFTPPARPEMEITPAGNTLAGLQSVVGNYLQDEPLMLEMPPKAIDFTYSPVGMPVRKEIAIRNTGTAPLADLDARITGATESASYRICSSPALPLAPGASTTLVVEYTAGSTTLSHASLTLVSPASGQSLAYDLTGTGTSAFQPVFDPSGQTQIRVNDLDARTLAMAAPLMGSAPLRGTSYLLVDNVGVQPVTGTFLGLPEGSIIPVHVDGTDYKLVLSYAGGDGNDVVLHYWDADGAVDPDAGTVEFLFCALDGSRDDRLAQEEWRSIYTKAPAKETIFAAIDTNHDGFLSFAEFQAAEKSRSSARTMTAALDRTEAFLTVDTSLDNVVSRGEYLAMWKPGTDAKTIAGYFSRAGVGSGGTDFWGWLWAPTLPSLTVYEEARKMRGERMEFVATLDANHNQVITVLEFSRLFKPGTKITTIDTAWRAANGTPRGANSPLTMTPAAFVEAPKLPKLVVY